MKTRMKLNSVNQWLMLFANLGVIFGLAALAIEINQSNRIAVREARESNAESMFEVAKLFISSPELMQLQLKLRDRNAPLTEPEREYAKHLAAIYISIWGKLRIQHTTDLLPPGSLQFGINGAQHTIHEYPGLAPFVGDFFKQRNISPKGGDVVWDPIWDALEEVMSRTESNTPIK